MLINICGQKIEDDGTHYHIHIKKPIYGHCVAISSKVIMQARYNQRLLYISCPGAIEETSPDGWVWKSHKCPKNGIILWIGTIGETEPKKHQHNQRIQLTLL